MDPMIGSAIGRTAVMRPPENAKAPAEVPGLRFRRRVLRTAQAARPIAGSLSRPSPALPMALTLNQKGL